MTKIKKWLDEQGIAYTLERGAHTLEVIRIMIEPNCTWENGFGESMQYDKRISIWKDRKVYLISETIGYNQVHTIYSSKQDNIVEELQRRFKEEK